MDRLLNDVMPDFDARERHETVVRADAERVWRALWSADLAGSPLVRLLLLVRALPTALRGGRARRCAMAREGMGRLTLAGIEAHGFRVLAAEPPGEVVLGLVGRFWTPRGDLRPVEPARFREPPAPGLAHAAWNFAVVPRADGSCLLTTETRVRCADDDTRRRFLRYWRVIRPGSGLIRRLALRAVRREAER